MADNTATGGNFEKKVTFRLDGKRHDDLAYIAKQQGASVSFVVRHLVCRYLEQQQLFSPVGSSQIGGDSCR